MTLDLNKGAGLYLDRSRVPPKLHSLLPIVERWAFKKLADQDRFAEAMLRERPDEVAAFNRAMDAAQSLIDDWGEQIPNRHYLKLSESDRLSPYWSFLDALKVRELTGYDESDPEVQQARARFASENRLEAFRAITQRAGEAFREREYREFIELLQPYEDLLTESQKKKIEFAERKVGQL